MADIVLTITQPAHGAGLNGPTALTGTATSANGVAGLFFKWFSPLNANASQAHPEINSADHSLLALNGSVSALSEFGSHALLLTATDKDSIALDQVVLVQRAALAGGAPLPAPLPPNPPPPCVAHQVRGALIRTPAIDNQTLSKAATNTTIEVLAPGEWLKPDPLPPDGWILNDKYQLIHGVVIKLRLVPSLSPTPANSAEIALDLAALPFFRADDKSWLRWVGKLPANLGLGSHTLSLVASAGSGSGAASATVSRSVVLAA